jgi:dimethylhistidine N-methyltransferase
MQNVGDVISGGIAALQEHGQRPRRSYAQAPGPAQATSAFARDVLHGLQRPQKSVPPKYFYDERGSRLFEAITRTPEYYPTRTETALLKALVPELATLIASDTALVEFGSGASLKTRLLLAAAHQITTYMPIEISREALNGAVQAVRERHPTVWVHPLCADFTKPIAFPRGQAHQHRLGFFPGSTIGNLSSREATAFLANARRLLGPDAMLLVGADLVKDEATLVRAYDDASGVTATFNKNLLVRINRELAGDMDVDAFEHRAVWSADESRIEMHLKSVRAQRFLVAGRTFLMDEGETIHTENSRKFTLESFFALADEGGWRVERVWASPPPAFAIFLLRPQAERQTPYGSRP